MTLASRGRGPSVLGLILAGGAGVISSTQTWLVVQRADGAAPLAVAGADVLALLAPLSLAVLALGAALSVAGRVLRHVLAALALAAGVLLIVLTAPLAVAPPVSAAASAVTDATGLAGDAALDEIVAAVHPTAWPSVALVGWILLVTVSMLALLTARRWKSGGRRYRAGGGSRRHDAGPLDPVDSWDELSHGTDPTDGPR